MRNILRWAACVAIVSFVFCVATAWKKAVDVYESKFSPPFPWDSKQVYFDDDPYIWVINAEDMLEKGAWRIRHTEVDNVPWGREMHYSQSLSWLMLLTGRIHSWISGEPMLAAISKAGIWVNPILFSVLLIGIFLLIENRMGFAPAAIAVVWMAGQGEVAWAFHPLRPDHQTLHIIFSVSSLILLSLSGLGWIETRTTFGSPWLRPLEPPGSRKIANRYFIAAGIAQGLGFWIGAIVQTAFLAITVGAVGIFALFFARRLSQGTREFDPTGWRLWAWSGAATSLLMYAVEYVPNHFSWRLEVNHPLYAIVWLASGEILTVLFSARAGSRWPTRPEWMRLMIGGVGIAALPATLFFAGAHVYVLRDPEYLRLLSRINEFQTYSQLHGNAALGAFFRNYLLIPVFFLTAWGLLLFRRLASYEFLALWVSVLLATGVLVLGFNQQRWLCFYAVLGSWIIALVVSLIGGRIKSAYSVWVALACVTIAVAAIPLYRQPLERMAQLREGKKLVEPVAVPMLIKRYALALGQALVGQDVRFMADAGLAAPLHYYSRLKSVGSFYWEDVGGLHDTDAFFDSTSDPMAAEILRARGITHVLTRATPGAAAEIHFVKTGNTNLDTSAPNLAWRMAVRPESLPRWLQTDSTLRQLEASRTTFGPVTASGNMRVWKVELPEAPPNPGAGPEY